MRLRRCILSHRFATPSSLRDGWKGPVGNSISAEIRQDLDASCLIQLISHLRNQWSLCRTIDSVSSSETLAASPLDLTAVGRQSIHAVPRRYAGTSIPGCSCCLTIIGLHPFYSSSSSLLQSQWRISWKIQKSCCSRILLSGLLSYSTRDVTRLPLMAARRTCF